MNTQRKLSEQLKISEQLFSMIKTGKRNMTYKLAKKLKKITGVKVEFWMEADEKKLGEVLNKLEINN